MARKRSRNTNGKANPLGTDAWKAPGLSDKEKYGLYLASRDWWVKREAVKGRCGGVCELCKGAPMTHVHHITYARKYNEDLSDLFGLCEPCHEFTHGKRDRDPMLDKTPKLYGVEIKTVYLAGRISNGHGAWRREIIPQWSVGGEHGQGFIGVEGGDCLDPAFDIKIPDGRPVRYVGPFWAVLGEHMPNGEGPHSLGTVELNTYQREDEIREQYAGTTVMALSDPSLMACGICQWIDNADLIFAWIDSREAYGTLLEIGYATASSNIAAAHIIKSSNLKRKVVVVAMPRYDRELWLACSLADVFIQASCPLEAWKRLWNSDQPASATPLVADIS